jgi:Fungalysin metallopeptidase (M36)/Fungalysin/Thermolysin Propeptide Motif
MRARTTFVLLIVVALTAEALNGAAGSTSAAVEKASQVSPSARAIAYVQAQHRRFGVTAADVADLKVTDVYRSTHTGVAHVYLLQRTNELEVAGGTMTVNLMPDGRVLHVASRLLRDINAKASGTAVLDAVAAVRAAAGDLGLSPSADLRILKDDTDSARTTRLSRAGISALPIPAKLVYQPTETGALRVAWNLEIVELSGEHWWNVSVDATTGTILKKIDLVDHDSVERIAGAVDRKGRDATVALGKIGPKKRAEDGSKYRVYPLPLESPNDGKRAVRKNPADALASPFGWHDIDGKRGYDFTTTQGNNVHAYLDPTGPGNTGAFPLMDAEGGEGLDFDFPVDYTLPPVTYKDAAVTNLFYWNNIIHDVFYRYGFNEKAGNFQINNYKRGGKGDDAVQAQAQDTGGVNNANFATPEDGVAPRMQMYIWPNGPTEVIDGDMDSGVITHEYGHGISNRLTGGPSKTGCLSAHDEREGEGWSDFLAIALTARKGDRGRDPRGMGTYVLGQSSRKEQGIRPTPYSTDMKINPSTYKTIEGAAEPHGVGYVWATMLWEVYWNLVDKHGFNPNPYGNWKSGGNNLTIQLVMDGMKMQPCEPGFVDARDAILAADKALTGGKNQCQIWAGFAKRGLGYKAKQKDPASKVDGVENFSTHPKCR